jgi:hypothetical protein
MGYEDFVWFILSEEDKTTDTALEYWFRCVLLWLLISARQVFVIYCLSNVQGSTNKVCVWGSWVGLFLLGCLTRALPGPCW